MIPQSDQEPYQPRISERAGGSRPLTVRAFAEAAQTSPRRIRRLIRQGRLSTTENQAGELRIPEAQLEKLLEWKERRALSRSMEVSAVSMEIERSPVGDAIRETYAMQVPLERHEAAMMRLGYLESELSTCKQQLHEATQREEDHRTQAEQLESNLQNLAAESAALHSQLEELRSSNVDSTLATLELREEVRELKARLNLGWWGRFLEALRVTKPEPQSNKLKPPPVAL